MVHPVKAPQERVAVEKYVYGVGEEIDNKDRKREFDLPVQSEDAEQAPGAGSREYDKRYQRDVDHNRVEGDKPDVPDGVPGLVLEGAVEREQTFQDVEYQEYGDEEDVLFDFGEKQSGQLEG